MNLSELDDQIKSWSRDKENRPMEQMRFKIEGTKMYLTTKVGKLSELVEKKMHGETRDF